MYGLQGEKHVILLDLYVVEFICLFINEEKSMYVRKYKKKIIFTYISC